MTANFKTEGVYAPDALLAGNAHLLVARKVTVLTGQVLSRGAVLGTITFVLLKELLSTHAIVGNAADHWQLTLGLAIIALVALLPKGLVGINDKWKKAAAQTDKSPAAIEQGADRG